MMQEFMMQDFGGMGWGMGIYGLLILVLLVLAIRALIKYLRSLRQCGLALPPAARARTAAVNDGR